MLCPDSTEMTLAILPTLWAASRPAEQISSKHQITRRPNKYQPSEEVAYCKVDEYCSISLLMRSICSRVIWTASLCWDPHGAYATHNYNASEVWGVICIFWQGGGISHRQHTFKFLILAQTFTISIRHLKLNFLLLNCETETLETWSNLIYFKFDSWTAQFLILTWAPSFPLTSLGISVWDHFEVPQGDTWVRSELKFTVLSLLWINCRMFQAKSLCLKENIV